MNSIALFDPSQMPMPDYLATGFEPNIKPRETVPTLTYSGKMWTVIINGEKMPITRRDEDGDQVPVSTIRVMVVNYNPDRGRSYYTGAFDPNNPAPPACWSDDGVTPHISVQDKQAKKCGDCAWSRKGSKVNELGTQTTACSQHRMLAVKLFKPDELPVLRLKLAVTSDWDKNQSVPGFYAYQQFLQFLTQRGVNNTAQVVTKLRFDPNPAITYPKVLFQPERYLTREEFNLIQPLSKAPETLALLNGSWTPAGPDGIATTPADDEADEVVVQAPAAAVQAAPVPAQAAPPPPVEYDDADAEIVVGAAPVAPRVVQAAPVAPPKPVPTIVLPGTPIVTGVPTFPAATTPKARKAHTIVMDTAPKVQAATAPPPVQAAAAAPAPGVTPRLNSILTDWGQDE